MKGGKCRKTNVIYEANIVTDNNIHTYIGLSSNKIQKIAGHYTIINCKTENKNYQKFTQAAKLSKTVHKLKRNNINFKLDWKIV